MSRLGTIGRRGAALLGRSLKLGMVILSALIFSLLLLSLAAWTWPSLWLNSSMLERAARVLATQGITLRWDRAFLSAESLSFWKKRVVLSGDGVCLSFNDGSFHNCFRRVYLDADASLAWRAYHFSVRELELLGGELTVQPVPGVHAPSPGASSPPAWPEPPRWLGQLSLDRARVEVDRVTVKTLEPPLEGKAVLVLGNVPAGYELKVDLRQGGRRFDWRLDGVAEGNGIHGKAGGELVGLAPEVSKIALWDCRYFLKLPFAGERGGTLRLNCPGRVSLGPSLVKEIPSVEDFRVLNVVVGTDLSVDGRPEGAGRVKGNLDVSLSPIFASIKEGRAALTAEFEGGLNEPTERWLAKTELVASLAHFEKLVNLFRRKPWAVPVPFAALKGAVDVRASSRGFLAMEQGSLPFRFETRLHSATQRLNLDGAGELKWNPAAGGYAKHLALALNLADVQIELPHLDAGPPPNLVRDSRIRRGPPSTTAGPAVPEFSYDISLSTPPSSPLRLVSNLAKSPVPVVLDLKLSDRADPRGILRVGSFPVELFRRNGTVHHCYLGFKPDSKQIEIDGEVRVVYTDYTVRILIMGVTSAPQVRFVSEPPLPEDQVLAVLLFGRKIESLDSDQAASVGSARAGFTESAISLASMYVLASTPVESIGYDPASRVFTARVRLSDGTSLNVGSDMKELNRIGLRRRLSSTLSVATYLENPLEVTRSFTALLEWSKGY